MQVGFGGIAPGMFGLYVLTEGVLSLTPGPAVLFVAGRGLNDGAAAAFPAALGIVLANGVYFGLSALGVGAAIAALPTLFLLLKWLGAAYLLRLAWGAAFGARREVLAAAPDARGATLRAAMLLQFSNPKSLLFFVAVLPQFVVPAAPIGAQMAWLAAGSMVPELLILLAYARAAAAARGLLASEGRVRWVERAGGVLLAACAALVLAT
jgi:homoserine/homoserine lactone efflux protein